MNAEQLRGLGSGAFQLANIMLVATVVGPLVADPESWPKTYAILVLGLAGMTAWMLLWSSAFYLLGEIGRGD